MSEIIIFTDGSHIKPRNLCGYGIHFPNAEFKDIAKAFKQTPLTYQRAELYAIYKAIKIVNKHNNNLNILIYTDSEYSIKSLTIWIHNWKKNNWISSTKKPVMNQDIIQKIDKLMEEHIGKIKFKHVRAHTGKTDFESTHNDITDKLAKQGAHSTIN